MRTYRASSLGSCLKAQIALQLGYTPLATSDKWEAIYERGNVHEEECIAAMEAEGWEFILPGVAPHWWDGAGLEDEGQHYIELDAAGALVAGHLDGIATQDKLRRAGNVKVVEIKSPASFHSWERAHKTGTYTDPLMHRYAWQASVYMCATGLEVVVACVEDGQVRTFGIETPPFSLDDITYRVAVMEEFIGQGILPPDCSQADYPCPVAYLHEKPELDEDPALDTMVNEYAHWSVVEKSAKESKDKARKSLDAYLGVNDAYESPNSKVTRYTTTRKSYDYDGIDSVLAIAGRSLAEFTTEKETESIRITKKEGGS